MKYYTKILVWENKRRLVKLNELRNLILQYFNNSRAEFMIAGRIEEDAAREARVKINRIMDETHEIILCSGINPLLTWSPPAAVGGYVQKIDLIQNIFNIHRFQISYDYILDFIDRSIGIYQSKQKASLVRIFNPFFYISFVFEVISELPFIAIGKLGFNRQKAESSVIGRLAKGILYLITVMAALLTILHLLELIEPVKQFTHKLIDSNKVEGRSFIY